AGACAAPGSCAAAGGGTEAGRGCEFDGPEDLFDWVRSRGGLVDQRLFVHEGAAGRGVFAREASRGGQDVPQSRRALERRPPGPPRGARRLRFLAIGSGETIVSVPFELMILERDHPCDTVRVLSEELRKGRCSTYWPYLRFVKRRCRHPRRLEPGGARPAGRAPARRLAEPHHEADRPVRGARALGRVR
ncbi:unnamed protein product, partial [Prorocentrum cordatum]